MGIMGIIMGIIDVIVIRIIIGIYGSTVIVVSISTIYNVCMVCAGYCSIDVCHIIIIIIISGTISIRIGVRLYL